jgi:hypothetical protein
MAEDGHHKATKESVYVNLVKNPERHTGSPEIYSITSLFILYVYTCTIKIIMKLLASIMSIFNFILFVTNLLCVFMNQGTVDRVQLGYGELLGKKIASETVLWGPRSWPETTMFVSRKERFTGMNQSHLFF